MKMADKKSTKTAVVQEQANIENEFTKSQLLAADRFRDRRDVVNAVLAEYPDDAKFTVKAVEQKIEKFMKGQVK